MSDLKYRLSHIKMSVKSPAFVLQLLWGMCVLMCDVRLRKKKVPKPWMNEQKGKGSLCYIIICSLMSSEAFN